MNLTVKQQKEFERFQQPTMSLIGSYYEMPEEIKGIFISLLAAYEMKPTAENAKMLSDLVMGHEAASVKKARLRAYGAKAPTNIRAEVKKKYLDELNSVPYGVPTSGMMLVGLGIVSKEEKNFLMDIQSACRLLEDTLNPQREKGFEKKEQDYEKPSFLDQPVATKMQRLENMVHAIVDVSFMDTRAYLNELNLIYHTTNPEIEDARLMASWSLSDNTFIQKANAEALKTLKDIAKRTQNAKLSAELTALCSELSSQITEDCLTVQDYQKVNEDMKNTIIGNLLERRSKQILSVQLEAQRKLSQSKSR